MKAAAHRLGQRLRPWWPALAVALVVSVLVLIRSAAGVQPYGEYGAPYIEHLDRMAVLDALGRDHGGLTGFVDELDQAFPPAMHLVHVAIGQVFGHSAEAVVMTGFLWLLLLGFGVGLTTWATTRDRFAAGAAASGALLLPAAHGFATRYYYDLPMTAALWCGVGVAVLTWDERPLRGGLAAGAIWLFADLIKWSSLPFGGILLLAAAALPALDENGARTWRPVRRLAGLAAATALSVGGSLLWVKLAGAEGSLGTMSEVMWAGSASDVVGSGGLRGMIEGARAFVVEKGLLLGSRWDPAKFGFYGERTVTTVLSPLLALPLAGLVARGFVKRRDVVGFTLIALLGLLGFLVLWIPVLDERFLLTSVPALLIPAGIGLATVPSRARTKAAAVVAALGVWVAADFHLGAPPLPEVLGAGDSVAQRGWSAAGRTPSNRLDVREALWKRVASCSPRQVYVAHADQEMYPAGEYFWLDYRAMLHADRHGGRPLDVLEVCEEAGDGQLAFVQDDHTECLPGDWVEIDRLELGGEQQGRFIGVWRPGSLPPCE